MSLTLHYDFVTDKALTARKGPTLSITRATDALYRDSSGVVQTASSGEARFDHDEDGVSLGLLVEETRTNIALHSNDWTDAVYDTVTNITAAKDATGPDGSANSASTLTADANNGVISQSITVASAAFTTSIWMKRKTGTGTVEITDNGFTNATDVTSDLSSTKWRQVGKITRTQANPVVGVRLGTSGDEVEVAYLQVEAGTFATSPIETSTSSVTRNADVIETSDVSWFNETAGSFYDSVVPYSETVATKFRWSISDNTDSHRHTAWIGNPGTTGFVRMTETGNHTISAGEAYATDQETKASYGYAADDLNAYFDGTQVTVPDTDTSGSIATGVSVFHIGTDRTDINQLNGLIKEIRYYNTRLTNAQLEDMSNGIFPPEGGLQLVSDVTRDVTTNVTRDATG